MTVAFVVFPPGGPGLIVKAKLIGFPRASGMTIFVVDVPPDVSMSVAVIVPIVWLEVVWA
jgi:hypothetical protein